MPPPVTRRSLVALLAALVALCVAAPAASADPAAALSQATGPLAVTGNAAVLLAQGLLPGVSQASEVTVTNVGSAGGVTLAASDLVDTGGLLSPALDLAVEDVTAGRAVYAGALDKLSSLDLGTFAAGEARRYRVTTTGSAGLVGALLSAVTSVRLTWTGAAVSGGIGGGVDSRTPRQGIASTSVRAPRATLTARAARDRVTATITCSTGCRVSVGGTAWRRGVKTRLRVVTRTLRRAGQVRVVVKLPAAARRAAVRLRLRATMGTPAVTVRRTVRVPPAQG